MKHPISVGRAAACGSIAVCLAFALPFCVLPGTAHAGAARAPRSQAVFAGADLIIFPWRTEVNGAPEAFRYVFEVRSKEGRVELVTDRRLLRFEITGKATRRPIRCEHPDAGAAARDRLRTMTLEANLPTSVYREWVDLRSYCWGRALSTLQKGATLHVSYGLGTRARSGWVARLANGSDPGGRAIVGGSVELADPPSTTPSAQRLRVQLQGGDVARGQDIDFRVSVRSAGGSARVYLRDDLFRFWVHGPLGDVDCSLERLRVTPVADFYQTISERRSAHVQLDGALVCPRAFDAEGIYEVTPIVDLPYESDDPERPAVTGTFVGPKVAVRVRKGQGPYQPRTFPPTVSVAHEGPSGAQSVK